MDFVVNLSGACLETPGGSYPPPSTSEDSKTRNTGENDAQIVRKKIKAVWPEVMDKVRSKCVSLLIILSVRAKHVGARLIQLSFQVVKKKDKSKRVQLPQVYKQL